MKLGKLRISWAKNEVRERATSSLPDSLINFCCSVCGFMQSVPSRELERERPSCEGCGSTVRFRAVARHLIRSLQFGASALAQLPPQKNIVGVGLSDWAGYSELLSEKFSYTNTYFHAPPQLDICRPPDSMAGTCDFVISSDVFEHVMPPVSNAFEGAAKLLRSGGVLVLTVPFVPGARTLEHYPEAVGYHVDDDGSVWIESANSRVRADRPVFHGGPGSTLEMRVFGSIDLIANLEAAGFTDIVVHAEADLEAGIIHRDLFSLPITARKR